MKKVFVLVSTLLMGVMAQAQLSTKLTLSTNYVSRGMSNSSGGSAYNAAGQPVIQGSLDYAMGDWSAQIFTTSVDSVNLQTFGLEKDTEIDYTLSYSKTVNDWTVGGYVSHYSFMRNEDNATTGWNVNVMYLFARVDYMRTENYSGLKSSLSYTSLSLFAPLSEKVMLQVSQGRSVWGTETNVGMSSYNDYKVGVRMTVSPTVEGEMSYTNTSGRVDLVTTNQEVKTDKALTFSLSTKFDL